MRLLLQKPLAGKIWQSEYHLIKKLLFYLFRTFQGISIKEGRERWQRFQTCTPVFHIRNTVLHLFSPYPSYSSAAFICKPTKQTMHNAKWPIEHTVAIISQACIEIRIALFDKMQGSRRNVTALIGADKLEASYTRQDWHTGWRTNCSRTSHVVQSDCQVAD